MAMNRRKFVGSMLAAGACAQALACSSEGDLEAQGNFNVRFDITGLFAFEHWQKDHKKLQAILADGPKSIGKPNAIHAPLMVMRWEDFDDSRMGGADYYTPPQPIQVGDVTLAVWSLADRVVWVGDVNPNGYDTDTASDLAFKKDNYGPNKPVKPNSDAEWEYLYWFVNMADVLKVTPPVKVSYPQAVTAKLLLTRGVAGGRKPKTKCDYERTYKFENVTQTPRAFSPHLVVTHPSAGSELTLRVATIADRSKSRPIYVKVKSGQPTGISIVNAPMGHAADPDHFKAFYKLVGADPATSPKLIVDQAEECRVSTKAMEEMHASPSGIQPSPPYEGCIPPGFPQDAP